MKDSFVKAKQIRDANDDIVAPINDIEECVRRIRGTGVDEEQVEKIVAETFRSTENTSYINSTRNPEKDEILVYNLPDDIMDASP